MSQHIVVTFLRPHDITGERTYQTAINIDVYVRTLLTCEGIRFCVSLLDALCYITDHQSVYRIDQLASVQSDIVSSDA